MSKPQPSELSSYDEAKKEAADCYDLYGCFENSTLDKFIKFKQISESYTLVALQKLGRTQYLAEAAQKATEEAASETNPDNAVLEIKEAIGKARRSAKSIISHLIDASPNTSKNRELGIDTMYWWLVRVQAIPISYKEALKECRLDCFTFLGYDESISGYNTNDRLDSIFLKIADWMAKNATTYRPDDINIYNALRLCPFGGDGDVKAIIIGQDPQPLNNKDGYADGLAFSSGSNIPSVSLRTILDAMKKADPDFASPPEVNGNYHHGDLTHWARQGVLLLNTHLTCGDASLSHEDAGWRYIVGMILDTVLIRNPGTPVILFGDVAKQLAPCVTRHKTHRLFETPHPASVARSKDDVVKDQFAITLGHFYAATKSGINWSFPRSEL